LEHTEELAIIKRVIGGDTSAFESLVSAHQKNIYNLAIKMTGNIDDALDISQEAFLRAYTRLEGYRGESRFSVWLYRLTYNLCIDFLRKKPRIAVIPLTYQDDSGEEAELEIPDVSSLPENELLLAEKRRVINESIEELDDDHREIIYMREITGMSYYDISTVLGINEGTVKSRLSRARKNLAEILMSKGTFPDSFRQKDHNRREEVEEHE
jgi:RNA polymerase sigma-70 factor (ECF subfamily)